jgi:mono/diheme cytochrome c family protein
MLPIIGKITVPLFFTALFFLSPYGLITLQVDWKVPDQFKNKKNPYAQTVDEDEIGNDLYKVHCQSYHGKTGLGDGSKAFDLDSDVKDFTAKSFKVQPDGAIYYKMIMGRNEMPSFDKKIKLEEDRWLLVNYLRSL